MSPLIRIAGFAVILAAVFAAAVYAGDITDPEPLGSDDPEPAMEHAGSEPDAGHGAEETAGHGGADAGTAPRSVRGLAVEESGLTLELADTALPRARRSELAFRVLRRDGSPQTRFDVEHEKRMHLIVVRRDGRGFQHLHPVMDRDGTWRTAITIGEAGSYRVFADFTTAGEASTLAADLAVDGRADYAPLPAPATSTRTTDDAYEVRLEAGRPRAGREASLRFTVFQDGHAVHTEPYLGAGGHLVALREGDLAYLHTHPGGHDDAGAGGAETHDDAVAFESEFPSSGRYRLYFQFKHAGRVHTAEFTQEVSR